VKKCSFFSLCLSLSLLNCVLQQNSSSFYMKFCIKSETTFERKKRKERKNFGEDTFTRPYTKWGCFVSVQKFFGKRIPQKTHVINRVSQNHWNPTLSQEYKKNTKPLLLTRAQKKKWCVPRWWKVAFSTLTCCEGSPPGGNSLAVLYRRYCVELKVYDGWYISRARAQGGRFFARIFFLYSWRSRGSV
jgi:hypothetical protein